MLQLYSYGWVALSPNPQELRLGGYMPHLISNSWVALCPILTSKAGWHYAPTQQLWLGGFVPQPYSYGWVALCPILAATPGWFYAPILYGYG